MGSYLSANPTVAAEFRAAMNESIAYSQTHEAVVKQTLVKGLSLTPAVAAKQILATNWNPALNTASITHDRELHEAVRRDHLRAAGRELVWNP